MNFSKQCFFGWQGKLSSDLSRIKSPVLERSFSEVLSNSLPRFISNTMIDLAVCEKIYQRWGKFGPFGDLVEVIGWKNAGQIDYYVSAIGNLAYHKPGLAADMVVIFHDQHDHHIFVGVKRKHNPGRGKPALVGGFIDINGYELETPLQAALRETKEEIGLELELAAYSSRTFTDKIIYAPTQGLEGVCRYLGLYPTGDEEIIPTYGLKRIYQTTAYVLDLEVPGLLTKDYLRFLKAQDTETEGLVLADKSEMAAGISFGLSHHELIFKEALETLHFRNVH